MKIRTLLLTSVVTFSVLLLIISGLVIVTNQQIQKLVNQEDMANNIALEVGELGYLSNDYLLFHESQQAERWNTKFASISDDIASLSVDQPEQQAIVGNLKANLRNTRSVFDDIVSSSLQPGRTADIGFIQLSWSRMAVQSQGMVFDAGRLSNLLREELDGLMQERNLLIFALMGVFIAFLLTSYFIFYRRALKSISVLNKGTRVIGSGDLNYTVVTGADDEIGEIARALNRMTADLRNVTTSKTDLEQEVSERMRAEAQLVRNNEDLNALNEKLIAAQEELHRNLEELSRAEKKLQEIEQRFRLALRNAPVSVIIQDMDLVILWTYNPRTKIPQDIVGKTDTDIFLPEDAARLIELKRKVIVTGKEAHEQIWLTVNRERLFFNLYLEPLRDNTGKITGVGTAAVDLTREKLTEIALRDNEKRLREADNLLEAVTDATKVIIAAEDTNFRYTYFNKTYASVIRRLTGKELAPGVSMIDVFSDLPEEQRSELGEWNRVLTGENVNQRIGFDNPVTGKTIYNVLHVPLRDEKGTIIGAGEVAFDVTAQVQVENMLRETSQYLTSLIDYANAPIIVWDREFRITRFNHAFEHLTGRKAGDVIGQPLDILLPPAYLDEAINLIKRTSGGERWESVEIPILHKKGSIRTVLWNSASTYGPDGKTIVSTIAQGQDITDRKETEKTLRETSQYLTSLIDYANAPIIVWDREFHITRFNHAFEHLTGRKAGDVIGQSLDILLPPPDLKPAMDLIRKTMEGERWESVEIPILHKKGGIRTVLWNSAAIFGPDGKTIVSTIAQGQDITDRKKIESDYKLRASEYAKMNIALKEEIRQRELSDSTLKKTLSLLNASLESTADGILVIDLQGKITSYNQNFMDMLNIPRELLESMESKAVMKEILPQIKDHDRFLTNIRELREHPERQSYDMIELNDGRIFERYSKPQKIGDCVVGRVWSYRDITDRKRAEERLVTSLQEKEVLLREIHHRVKNNLQLISGLLDMTRMRTKDESTNSILTDMMLKIQTMAQIHTRLYESKQFGKISLTVQIRDQIAALSNIYSHEGHEITCEINSGEVFLPVDQAIPCALVVNEILSNAYKHAFPGRKHGTIEISALHKNGQIRISVRDDGIGIPETFDISRANSLGLKLIRALVQHQLKGSIMIISKNGTEMIVEFPVITTEI